MGLTVLNGGEEMRNVTRNAVVLALLLIIVVVTGSLVSMMFDEATPAYRIEVPNTVDYGPVPGVGKANSYNVYTGREVLNRIDDAAFVKWFAGQPEHRPGEKIPEEFSSRAGKSQAASVARYVMKRYREWEDIR